MLTSITFQKMRLMVTYKKANYIINVDDKSGIRPLVEKKFEISSCHIQVFDDNFNDWVELDESSDVTDYGKIRVETGTVIYSAKIRIFFCF